MSLLAFISNYSDIREYYWNPTSRSSKFYFAFDVHVLVQIKRHLCHKKHQTPNIVYSKVCEKYLMRLYNAHIKDTAVHVSAFFNILCLFIYICYMFCFLPFILIVFLHFRFHYSSTHFLKSRLLIYMEAINPNNTQHHATSLK